ncbi:hypothetical protein Tco_0744487 [Tanacetum coccineum]
MAISVISVSSDLFKKSIRTSTGRVILFGTIPTTIPNTTPFVIPPSTHIDTALTPTLPEYTPASPNYSPASDTKFDPSKDPLSDHIPPLPTTSPFLSSTDDSSDTSGALRRRFMVLVPGQPIPHGRPYRYHLNRPVHMMTTRKRVGPLPTHLLVVRHLVDYSSSDHFSSDDSSSSLSSETSSDPSSDDLSDSSSGHSLPAPSSCMRPSHHLCSLVPSVPRSSVSIFDRPSHDSSSASPSCKRSRSPVVFVPLSSPISGVFSYARTGLLPSPKRIRSPESATDLEVSSAEGSEPSRYKGTELEMDDDVKRSDGIDIDLKIQAEIDECIAYADALRDKGVDARVVVEAVDREEIEMGARGPVEVRVDRVTHPVIADDIPEPAQGERAVEVAYETLRRFRFTMTMPNTRSGASRTREGINEQIDRQLAGVLGARDAARNLEPLIRGGGEQEEISENGVNGNRGNKNRGNKNGGNRRRANGNGNGNEGRNGYNPGGFVHVAQECTYQDFLKC